MCGIAGFAGRGTIAVLREMCRALVHRGPDAEGVWKDPDHPVFLGHRRLSILDLAGGAQPMWTKDGALGIVFNGEIYNHAELRAELQELGCVFHTDHSDTEVLLQGYRLWGEALLGRLNGMWSFVIYDRSSQELFGSRDRFGKKPFYYSVQPGSFAFASELSALRRHPDVSAEISLPALKRYFAYGYIPAPHTFYRKCYKLPAGHLLRLHLPTMRLTVKRYWEFQLEPFERIPAHPCREWGEELRRILDAAVRRRLVADVPVGVFLSGGIDSSAVTAFAARHVGNGNLKAFSIGFRERSFDESEYARQVARLLGVQHHVEIFSLMEARTLLPDLIQRLDEPMADGSLLPTSMLCGHARRSVTVALGGDGADELFGGYDTFKALHAAEWYRRHVPAVLKGVLPLACRLLPVSHDNMSWDFRLRSFLRGVSYPPALWNAVWMSPLTPEELSEFLGEPIDPEELYEETLASWKACRQDNPVDRTLQFFTNIYLQDDILTKMDRAGMMHSLEVRSPFLDIDLVNFVRRIPYQYKYSMGRTKILLKSSLSGILPEAILHRPKKGFGIPVGEWFAEGRLPFPETQGLPGIGGDKATFARHRYRRHRARRDNCRLFLWSHWLLASFLQGSMRLSDDQEIPS